MKALLLAENWPPRVGGIENYLRNIVEHLPDCEITVVAPSVRASSTPGVSPSTPGVFPARVVRSRFFWPIVKPAWLPLFLSLYRKAKKEKYDVVLCGKALFEGLVGYYLKKRLGIPYVVFTYAMEIEVWADEMGDRKKMEKVLKEAARVVYINEVTKNSLKELGVEENRLVKICPGVEERFLKDVSEEDVSGVLKKYDVERPYIVTVARLIERKGIDVLIEAFGQLDQTRFGDVGLIIVGEGEEREELEKLAGHLFVEESVKFLRQVPDKDLPALYKGAEIFALTPQSYEDDMEGFGIVYLEAAGSGLPSVATDSGGVKEAVVHEKTGLLVEEDSPEAVKEALEKLLGDDDLKKNLGRQAQKRVRKEFAWAKRVVLVQNMIDSVVKKRV